MKHLLLICSLPTVLVGCSAFQSSQPPAPVYGTSTPPPAPSKKVTPAKIQKKPKPVRVIEQPAAEPEVLQTSPLGESRAAPTITPIESPVSVPLTFEQEQALLEQELHKNMATELQKNATTQPALPTEPPVAFEPPPPPPPDPPPPAFQPLETFAPFSPVVGSLVVAANQTTAKGDAKSAAATIERAIRIEPRNPALFYKLALLRLNQTKPKTEDLAAAENLAKKSALLASNDTQLKKHSWLLIARSREMRGDKEGGKKARAMAEKF